MCWTETGEGGRFVQREAQGRAAGRKKYYGKFIKNSKEKREYKRPKKKRNNRLRRSKSGSSPNQQGQRKTQRRGRKQVERKRR